jgi:hypothetical protein
MVREDCWSSSAGCSPERSSPSCSRSDDRRLVHVWDDRRRGQPVVIPTSLAVAPRDSLRSGRQDQDQIKNPAPCSAEQFLCSTPTLASYAPVPEPSQISASRRPVIILLAPSQAGCFQDRQKLAHPGSVSKISYVRIAADCLDRELSGRSPPAIWTPHTNRRRRSPRRRRQRTRPFGAPILSDAFPPLLPLVIGQTRVRDFN